MTLITKRNNHDISINHTVTHGRKNTIFMSLMFWQQTLRDGNLRNVLYILILTQSKSKSIKINKMYNINKNK